MRLMTLAQFTALAEEVDELSVSAKKDGEYWILHINQPKRPAIYLRPFNAQHPKRYATIESAIKDVQKAYHGIRQVPKLLIDLSE